VTQDVPVVCLERNGYEARYFVDAIRNSEQPDRIAVVGEIPEAGSFVYPIRYSPPGRGRHEAFEYLDELTPNMHAAMRDGRVRLVFDSSNERLCPSGKQITLLHAKLEQLNIALPSVTFLTQNTAYSAVYAAWCAANGVERGFHVANHHYFLRELANFVTTTMIPSGEFAHRRSKITEMVEKRADRAKNYLCLNYTPRAHRVATMLYLLEHDLLRRGYVSFSGLKGRKYDITAKVDALLDKSPFPDIAELRRHLPRLTELGALSLDDLNGTPVIDIGQTWYYLDSYFSLVTESGIKPLGENSSFTEKPFKAVLGLHPFIIMGTPGNLREVRRYGFQTFAPGIDESYDEVRNDTDRVRMALEEFKRLAFMKRDDIKDLYKSLLPQILHNYEHFAGGLQAMFRDEFEAGILQHLSRQD